jgi:hypothetical protein
VAERLPFSRCCWDPARITDYHTHVITKHQYNNSRCEHSDVSWHTALSRLKVTIAASATLCCHLLVRLCTLVYKF